MTDSSSRNESPRHPIASEQCDRRNLLLITDVVQKESAEEDHDTTLAMETRVIPLRGNKVTVAISV